MYRCIRVPVSLHVHARAYAGHGLNFRYAGTRRTSAAGCLGFSSTGRRTRRQFKRYTGTLLPLLKCRAHLLRVPSSSLKSRGKPASSIRGRGKLCSECLKTITFWIVVYVLFCSKTLIVFIARYKSPGYKFAACRFSGHAKLIFSNPRHTAQCLHPA